MNGLIPYDVDVRVKQEHLNKCFSIILNFNNSQAIFNLARYMRDGDLRHSFNDVKGWVNATMLEQKLFKCSTYAKTIGNKDQVLINDNLQEDLYHNYFAVMELAEKRNNAPISFNYNFEKNKGCLVIKAGFSFFDITSADILKNRFLVPVVVLNSVG